jgi:hypothetical protein
MTELTQAQKIENVLSQIKQYAMEHNLSAERVHDMFNVGIVAARLLLDESAADDEPEAGLPE